MIYFNFSKTDLFFSLPCCCQGGWRGTGVHSAHKYCLYDCVRDCDFDGILLAYHTVANQPPSSCHLLSFNVRFAFVLCGFNLCSLVNSVACSVNLSH